MIQSRSKGGTRWDAIKVMLHEVSDQEDSVMDGGGRIVMGEGAPADAGKIGQAFGVPEAIRSKHESTKSEIST